MLAPVTRCIQARASSAEVALYDFHELAQNVTYFIDMAA